VGLGKTVAALTTLVNLVVLLFFVGLLLFFFIKLGKTESKLGERFHAGKVSSSNKIAIIRIEGVLFEGLNGYAFQQIETAAKDDQVKAIVLRINSPGGTITASDHLHKQLNDLRNGTHPRYPGPAKPIVISMSSVAASGGYYIAMIKSTNKRDPATIILAEPTTITGSIGVYASFPNVAEWAKDNGVTMNVIKAGDLKASGSLFKEMSKEETEVWQNMIDHAYLRFLKVITQARGLSAEALQDDLVIKETVPIRQGVKRSRRVSYTRYRADGGIFTAEQAVRYHLIDRIGYTSDAIEEAAKEASLGEDFRAITYERPSTLLGSLLGVQSTKPAWQFDATNLSSATTPHLWYLAPQHGLAGMAAALGR
jgi:protease-4